MNLRDLRYVVSVAELGHFGRAATACNVSQPTLSGQILKLEEELGVAIFERVGKRVRPTPVGEQIIGHARKAIGAATDIAATARASRDPLAGVIRLGVIPTIAPYLMPFALPAAAEKMPRAPLTLIEDLTGRLLPILAAGDLDAAIIATSPDNDRLAEIDLYDEPFFLVMSRKHALASQTAIEPDQIDRSTLLLLTDGHCLRDQALDLCHQTGSAEGLANVRASSLETLLQLAAANYGSTLAPALAVAGLKDDSRIVARRITGGNARRQIRLVYRRDMPRRHALTSLAEAIRGSLPASAGQASGIIIGTADHF